MIIFLPQCFDTKIFINPYDDAGTREYIKCILPYYIFSKYQELTLKNSNE